MLEKHPDQGFASYLSEGIKYGFRIGFNYDSKLKSAKGNMKSALEHPEIVQAYLDKEVMKHRVILLEPFGLIPIQVSRFGVIPKRHQPGQWRLILDLSSPDGKSVNDGIERSLCSLQYEKVESVAKHVYALGIGALMAKTDVKSAFRIVPVHPDDRLLLSMEWDGKFYVDATLPFGLRSAPKIFNTIADALECICKYNGISSLWHYLDDYITTGPPSSDACANNLDMLSKLCKRLGIPLAEDKTVGPTPKITFLGIEIDSVAQELRIPNEKLARLVDLVQSWLHRSRATKRELESLAGFLEDAAKIVKPGRTFIRRIYSTISSLSKPHHHIRINQQLHSDIAWWHSFLTAWNGVSLMSVMSSRSPEFIMLSDASGSWGCGALWDVNWFQLPWSETPCYKNENIATKELLPIGIASAIWGPQWSGKTVMCKCDNQAVVAILASRTCRDNQLMHLLRCLFFFESHFNFSFMASHIPGVDNDLADDLSRDNLESFMQKQSGVALPIPTTIPFPLLDMLVITKPDWTSQSWRDMFNGTLNKV